MKALVPAIVWLLVLAAVAFLGPAVIPQSWRDWWGQIAPYVFILLIYAYFQVRIEDLTAEVEGLRMELDERAPPPSYDYYDR